MDKNEGSGSPGWSASLFVQTTEDVARYVAAAASAATVRSPRPSVIFSSKDESSTQLQKLQQQLSRVLKGFSPPPEEKKRSYNPEILTSQKRQWASFQLQFSDQRSMKEPSRLFESMVIVGLNPNSDSQELQKKLLARNLDGRKKSRNVLNHQGCVQTQVKLEPQVLFVYPPEKQLPLKYKDLLSFCFPGGLEEHLKQSDLSFVFRLQVADDSTLYGCCVLVEEIVQKPSALISMLSEEQPFLPSLTRHIITAPRCYCILSRLPFFDLHFGILKSIFTEERLRRLTKGIDMLNLILSEENCEEDDVNEPSDSSENKDLFSEASVSCPISSERLANNHVLVNNQMPEGDETKNSLKFEVTSEVEGPVVKKEVAIATPNDCDASVDEMSRNKQTVDKLFPEAVLPLLRYYQHESSESGTSFQDSPIEDTTFRSDMEEIELDEPSSSGQEDSNDHNDILEWAKANNHGSLQIICDYYQFRCPARGSTLNFHPLEHLHPLEFHRPGATVLHIAGSTVDLRSCSTSLELAEAHSALLTEEEATALSVWTVACICGNLRLEHVLMMFAGALLEKQIVVVCSNLGILSAVVLSAIPLIRPYQWQSLLMPVLPNDMLDFLDAPVPYIVGIKNKTSEVQSKLSNAILIDADKNQVKSHSIPHLPQQKELFSSLSPYHQKLVGESYLARKRPVYECTDVQVEAAKGFLAVLRSYLDSLCSNLRSHTITNVQSNDDKVSLLLKESFIESYPSRDRPFMKLFVDTQLFSVHTDLVLSFYQKD
uniref:DENN domain-containing protein 5B n=1 Tax=Anthurium amnicola TaxID=1678845 RepID=A0A1D1ZAK2_9ARAE